MYHCREEEGRNFIMMEEEQQGITSSNAPGVMDLTVGGKPPSVADSHHSDHSDLGYCSANSPSSSNNHSPGSHGNHEDDENISLLTQTDSDEGSLKDTAVCKTQKEGIFLDLTQTSRKENNSDEIKVAPNLFSQNLEPNGVCGTQIMSSQLCLQTFNLKVPVSSPLFFETNTSKTINKQNKTNTNDSNLETIMLSPDIINSYNFDQSELNTITDRNYAMTTSVDSLSESQMMSPLDSFCAPPSGLEMSPSCMSEGNRTSFSSSSSLNMIEISQQSGPYVDSLSEISQQSGPYVDSLSEISQQSGPYGDSLSESSPASTKRSSNSPECDNTGNISADLPSDLTDFCVQFYNSKTARQGKQILEEFRQGEIMSSLEEFQKKEAKIIYGGTPSPVLSEEPAYSDCYGSPLSYQSNQSSPYSPDQQVPMQSSFSPNQDYRLSQAENMLASDHNVQRTKQNRIGLNHSASRMCHTVSLPSSTTAQHMSARMSPYHNSMQNKAYLPNYGSAQSLMPAKRHIYNGYNACVTEGQVANMPNTNIQSMSELEKLLRNCPVNSGGHQTVPGQEFLLNGMDNNHSVPQGDNKGGLLQQMLTGRLSGDCYHAMEMRRQATSRVNSRETDEK